MSAIQTIDASTMTVEEYLAFADEQYRKYLEEGGPRYRYEYADGKVYAMVGGTFNHALITANISRTIGNQIEDRDCRVVSPDLGIQIASKRRYRYADVTAICGPPEFYNDRTDLITNPTLLVEVSSPSTTSLDRTGKLSEYM
jgi:Uma2 family endonuclease